MSDFGQSFDTGASEQERLTSAGSEQQRRMAVR
jgi:hypothetical protein